MNDKYTKRRSQVNPQGNLGFPYSHIPKMLKCKIPPTQISSMLYYRIRTFPAGWNASCPNKFQHNVASSHARIPGCENATSPKKVSPHCRTFALAHSQNNENARAGNAWRFCKSAACSRSNIPDMREGTKSTSPGKFFPNVPLSHSRIPSIQSAHSWQCERPVSVAEGLHARRPKEVRGFEGRLRAPAKRPRGSPFVCTNTNLFCTSYTLSCGAGRDNGGACCFGVSGEHEMAAATDPRYDIRTSEEC